MSCSYEYTPSVVLTGELDGLRIISSSTCEFLQKVPGTSPQFIQETKIGETDLIRLIIGGLQPRIFTPGVCPLRCARAL